MSPWAFVLAMTFAAGGYGLAAEGACDHWLWPFAANSIWNMPLGSEAQYVPAEIGKAARVDVDDEMLYRVGPGAPTRPVFAPKAWDHRERGTVRLGDVRIPDDLLVPDAWKGYTPNNCAALLMPDNRTVVNIAPESPTPTREQGLKNNINSKIKEVRP